MQIDREQFSLSNGLYWKTKSNEKCVQNIVDSVALQVNYLYLSESWQFKVVFLKVYLIIKKLLNTPLSSIRNSTWWAKESVEIFKLFYRKVIYGTPWIYILDYQLLQSPSNNEVSRPEISWIRLMWFFFKKKNFRSYAEELSEL